MHIERIHGMHHAIEGLPVAVQYHGAVDMYFAVLYRNIYFLVVNGF
jgi:hypothetical protein